MTTPADTPVAYACRRAALKGRVLMAASLVIEDAVVWETLHDDADLLHLSEETLSAVVREVSDELFRRACRLPTLSELDS